MLQKEKYDQVLREIQKLRKSEVINYEIFHDMEETDNDHIVGVITFLSFLGREYLSVIRIDEINESVKIEINLGVCTIDHLRNTLLAYLITLNLLSNYDCDFSLDTGNSVHISTEVSCHGHVPKQCELETATENMLYISFYYRTVIKAIAYGEPVPDNPGMASIAYYNVLCDEDTVIIPCEQRIPLSLEIGDDFIPPFRYIKLE